MVLASSITEPIIDFAVNVISDLGLPGIFFLMLLDSACIPTSSEAIMLFAGFNVSDGRWTLFEVVAAGTLGNIVGSWIAYGIGYYGRLELLEKHGKWLHITPKHLAWADRWFERHGGATVFWARMMPVVRTFISLPAGVARMPFWKFTWMSTLGIIPWVTAFAIAGREVKDNWQDLQSKLHYIDYLIIAVILGYVAYLVIKWRRGGGGKSEDSSAGASKSEPVDQAAADTSS